MYGALPDVEIEQDDKLQKMWEMLGAEIKSSGLTMLHVTPQYIVLVSNPAEIVVAEDESELALKLRGFIAAKHTRRESWQTISPTGGIRVHKGEGLESVLASIHGGQGKGAGLRCPFHRDQRVGKSEFFRCARTRVGIHRIADHAAKENFRL